MFYQLSSYIKRLFENFLPIGRSFGNGRVQGFYGRLLGPVSDHVLFKSYKQGANIASSN